MEHLRISYIGSAHMPPHGNGNWAVRKQDGVSSEGSSCPALPSPFAGLWHQEERASGKTRSMRFRTRFLVLAICAAFLRFVKSDESETKPAACQSIPQTEAVAVRFGALQTAWPVLASGQYAALILFGTCIFSWAILRVQSGIRCEAEAGQSVRLASFSNPSSVLFLARESAAASGIFLFAFACEYFPIFATTERTWNVDDFTFYSLACLAMTIASVKKVKDASLLNRLQTDEWKGWMQWLFIMYHYCAATSIYSFIRVFICAYVWMTGFGNFIYFTTTGNFCLGRFIHMMWRLNFAVLMLMLVMNKSWMVYYICPLHTFYFVLTFLVCFIYNRGNKSDGILRLKILTTFIAIALLWDSANGVLFNYFWGFLSSEEGAGGTRGGTLWEWYFRTSLDKYACAFGMLAGLNREKLADVFGGSDQHRGLRYALMALSVAYIAWWCYAHAFQPKMEYNTTNAFFAPGVVMAFVVLRNCTALFRQHYFALPAQLGRISLESYLLQYHVWLACSATRLLVVVPGMPKVNLLVTSGVFLVLANQLFDKTATLKQLLFSDKGSECVVVCCKLLLGLLAFYLLGVLVDETGGGLVGAGCLSLVLALAVSQAVRRGSRYELLHQADHEEAGPAPMAVEPAAAPSQRLWLLAAAALWTAGLVALQILGAEARGAEATHRVPAGQYSNLTLGAGTCAVALLGLALTSRIQARPPASEGVGGA